MKDWVIEPTLVKTVSYFKLSTLVAIRASGLVIKLSFVQEDNKSRIEKTNAKKPQVSFAKKYPVCFIDKYYSLFQTVIGPGI